MEILSIKRKIMMREITVEDVRSFLNSLNVKLDVYGMVFADRKRCQEPMRMLGINEVSFHEADFTIQYPFK